MDKLKVNAIPVILITLLLISAACAFYMAILNSGNQTILTSTATLIAAIAFYLLNMLTSLSESKPPPLSFAVEVTIDRSAKYLGARVYSLQQSTRAFCESQIMQKLVAANPDIFLQQEDSVRRDFIIASMLQWLSSEEFDWQSESKVLKSSLGTFTTKGIISQRSESVVINEAKLQSLLAQEGNVFASHFSMNSFKEIYLPRGSRFFVSQNAIEIEHPVFDLRIELEQPAKATVNLSPLSNKMDMMSNGQPRYSRYVYGATFTTKIKKFRSGSVDKSRFEAWFSRLGKGIYQWFELPSLAEAATSTPVGAVISGAP